jgi:hypothetical protein
MSDGSRLTFLTTFPEQLVHTMGRPLTLSTPQKNHALPQPKNFRKPKQH